MGWSSGQAALIVNHLVKVKQSLEDFANRRILLFLIGACPTIPSLYGNYVHHEDLYMKIYGTPGPHFNLDCMAHAYRKDTVS